ncbi:MAG: hypothetical protein OXG82_15925 [Gammaproteobacteria bacterium]|nr:hypothetical protein [Gammaproteobacteria bacterium]
MSYPHVRVAASGPTVYFATARDYADAADWTSRVATGWVRTRGREPVRLHESAERVHLVGGWTRLNASDEPILRNRVTYILTRPGLSWGIQARFALGAYEGNDEAAAGSAAEDATELVRRFYDALAAGDAHACAGFCRYPLIDVGVGEVRRFVDGEELARDVDGRMTGFGSVTVRAAQAGPDGVLVEVLADHSPGGGEQTVLVAGRWSGSWQIAGISRMLTP